MRPFERTLADLVAAAARRPRRVLLGLFLVTAVLAPGLSRLRFATDLLDWLPGRDPDVRAFARVIAELDSVTNQELVWLELEPAAAAKAGVGSILDEAAVRAQADFADHVRARVPEVRFVFGLPGLVALARAAGSSGDPREARLPESALEFGLLWNAVQRTQGELLETILARDRTASLLGFVIAGDPLSAEGRRSGRALAAAVASWVADMEKGESVLRTEGLVPIGLASGLARIDALLRSDLLVLTPVAAFLVLALLLLAFRDPRLVALAAAGLLLDAAWTFGLMGWLGIGVNLVNAALLPLLLGTGIDYAIHFLNAYRAARSAGDEAPLRTAAERTGPPLTLATLTTTTGLLSLALSAVPGLLELGLLAAVGMLALLLLTLTFLPAALALLPGGPNPAPRPRPAARRMVLPGNLTRRSALVVAALLTLAALALQGRQPVQLDVIQGNFPAGDPVTMALERVRQGTGGAFPEFVILQGDAADPAHFTFTEALERRLSENADQAPPRTLGLPRITGSYEVLRDGPATALPRFLAAGGELARAAPDDPEALRQTLEAMHRDPLWAPLAGLLSNPALDLSVLLVMPTEPIATLEQARRWRRSLEDALEQTPPPRGLVPRLLGYRTLSILFLDTTRFWSSVLFAVSLLGACLLVLLFTRSLRATAAATLTMLLAGLWWRAALVLAGLPESVFQLFPLIFTVGIGSDYAMHLVLARLRDLSLGDTLRAVLFSALTAAAVFLTFAWSVPVGITQVMLASALAVLCSFLAALAVPVLAARS